MFQPRVDQILELFKDELKDILDEIHDPRYANRQHGSRATSALGCNGPLCRKAERDRSRRRNHARAARQGRMYKEGPRMYDRDDLMDAIIRWHKLKMVERRMEGVA